jgi:hypothetical protein
MRTSNFSRHALSICVAMGMLTGCGGSQPPIGTPGAMAQTGTPPMPANRGLSWMATNATINDLLYVSNVGSNSVTVYSWRTGKLMGTLNGFSDPQGLCSDATGNVYIVDAGASRVYEYAHGGLSPIDVFPDYPDFPVDCSVDPTTGNLAVTNVFTESGPGNVLVYLPGQVIVKDAPNITNFYYCAYDTSGNLFVDGTAASNVFGFAELPYNAQGNTMTPIALNQNIDAPGGVQWRGKHVAVGDSANAVIYQFRISGSGGTKVGSTPLTGSSEVGQFWIKGTNVIGPDRGNNDVGFWKYPGGGQATKILTDGISIPFGATISLAK